MTVETLKRDLYAETFGTHRRILLPLRPKQLAYVDLHEAVFLTIRIRLSLSFFLDHFRTQLLLVTRESDEARTVAMWIRLDDRHVICRQ